MGRGQSLRALREVRLASDVGPDPLRREHQPDRRVLPLKVNSTLQKHEGRSSLRPFSFPPACDPTAVDGPISVASRPFFLSRPRCLSDTFPHSHDQAAPTVQPVDPRGGRNPPAHRLPHADHPAGHRRAKCRQQQGLRHLCGRLAHRRRPRHRAAGAAGDRNALAAAAWAPSPRRSRRRQVSRPLVAAVLP
ncbi:MAG: hypothetical protein ACK56F_19315, partial [bacterium]